MVAEIGPATPTGRLTWPTKFSQFFWPTILASNNKGLKNGESRGVVGRRLCRIVCLFVTLSTSERFFSIDLKMLMKGSRDSDKNHLTYDVR